MQKEAEILLSKWSYRCIMEKIENILCSSSKSKILEVEMSSKQLLHWPDYSQIFPIIWKSIQLDWADNVGDVSRDLNLSLSHPIFIYDNLVYLHTSFSTEKFKYIILTRIILLGSNRLRATQKKILNLPIVNIYFSFELYTLSSFFLSTLSLSLSLSLFSLYLSLFLFLIYIPCQCKSLNKGSRVPRESRHNPLQHHCNITL